MPERSDATFIEAAAAAGAAAAAAAAPGLGANGAMLPQSEMSRLVVFRGNSKDTVTAEAWAEMVDRHISVLKWSPEQTAGAAIESMRDEVNIWRENIAVSQTEKHLVKDWNALKPVFLLRFGKAKTRTSQIQGIGQLRQTSNESCNTYLDRVVHTLNKLTHKHAERCTEGDQREGFYICKDVLESALFLNGLRSDVKMFVDMDIKEDTTKAAIYEMARATETAVNSKNHKVHALLSSDDRVDSLTAKIEELRRVVSTQVQAGRTQEVYAIAKGNPKKAKTPGKTTPMSERRGPILCWKCKQWGKHVIKECKLTADEIAQLTPQSKEDKPTGEVYDKQYPNA